MINLQKGQRINIDPKKVVLGLGWTPSVGTGLTCDLDCSVFCLDENQTILNEKYFVFFNNLVSPCGGVKHSGDDTTGSNSAGGDDEQIAIDTALLDPKVKEILFIATIHGAKEKNQNFGQVKDAYIRIMDGADNSVLAKFDLNEDYSIETSIEFGRFYIKDSQWKFDASGIGYREELDYFVSKYYSGQVVK